MRSWRSGAAHPSARQVVVMGFLCADRDLQSGLHVLVQDSELVPETMDVGNWEREAGESRLTNPSQVAGAIVDKQVGADPVRETAVSQTQPWVDSGVTSHAVLRKGSQCE